MSLVPQPLKIFVPGTFFAERKYIADVIFTEFIGLPFTIEPSEELKETYIIEVDGKSIVMEDAFFSRTTEFSGYLHSHLIPQTVEFRSGPFLSEADIPLLFGTGNIETDKDIQCGHDIFASIFFMLSRWEECVLKKYDYLRRFPAAASLSLRSGFLHRPVVNEWVAMLKNMISFLQPDILFRPQQKFEIVFTHDIDILNAPVSVREFAKDVVRRKSLRALRSRLRYLLSGYNPYNIFDYFMDVSERHGTKSRFYFMTGHNITGKDGEPYNCTPLYKQTLQRIRERGHIIGFHPSLLSYNNPEMFASEKSQLETDIGGVVREGRQHALRFDLPDTWAIWESNGMALDSTLGYSAREGFRCGTGNVFTVFDVKSRRHLSLKEMPLVVMDTTLHVNRKLGIEESVSIIRQFVETGKRYDMPITLLFHNLIKDSIDWNGWKDLYDELFNNERVL